GVGLFPRPGAEERGHAGRRVLRHGLEDGTRFVVASRGARLRRPGLWELLPSLRHGLSTSSRSPASASQVTRTWSVSITGWAARAAIAAPSPPRLPNRSVKSSSARAPVVALRASSRI